MRSSVPGMSPAKIAIAVAVTIAPMRRHRLHEEGDRHQQRGRHGGGQAGHGADEQAEQRREQDDQST